MEVSMLTMMTIVGSICGGSLIFIIILAALLSEIAGMLQEAKEALTDPEWWAQWLPSC
jgi:hypothetical protein